MMAGFDGEAEAMATALEQLLTKVEQLATTAHDRMQLELRESQGIGEGLAELAIVLTLIGVLVSVAVMFVMHRHVVRPLSAMALALGRIGDGDLNVEVPDASRRSDEIADMAKALAILRDRTAENVRLREYQHLNEQKAEQARRQSL